MGVGDGRRLPAGTVTFLLTDVEGSSRLWEADPDGAAAVIERHRHILAEVIARHGGARPVEQGEGDSVVAAFARASDALLAARDGQVGLDGEPVRVRMALHSGEAEPSADGTYAGAVLNRCARLRALAHGGQVVVSEATRDLVIDHVDDDLQLRDLGTHRLRDLSRPEQVWQLTGPGMIDHFPALKSLDASPNNLPVQLSSFVGRDDEIARIVELVGETRLLTLTGTGGCGKTRLALRVAGEVSGGFADGVWWIPLAPLADGELIPTTTASAVGVRVAPDRPPLDAVCHHFASQTALLVIDNCEHVIDAAAEVVDHVLRAAPAVKVLTTSREPLGVEGEVTWRVPSLAVPPEATAMEPETLGQFDAVRLFIERAVQVRPNFTVTNDNAPAVAEICHRLDGIPLAIELAAARTRAIGPERIAAELGDRFRLLAGTSRTILARHQTLLASIDWSHNLLDGNEGALFQRLGVFAGGFTLDAAETVGAAPPLDRDDILDVLARLVSKSLVQHDQTTDRYRLLESIRHYALDRLADAGEQTATRDRHLAWAVELAESLEPAVTNAQTIALDRLEAEHDNLHAALDWADTCGQQEPLLRLIAALSPFWSHRGHAVEVQRWIAALPADASDDNAALVARARCMAAYASWHDWDVARAYELASAALDEARRGNDHRTEARSLETMAMALVNTDPTASRDLATEATDIARQIGDEWCEANSLVVEAAGRCNQGRPDAADETLDVGFPLVELLDNDLQRAWYGLFRGYALALRAQFSTAEHTLHSAIEGARDAGSPFVELTARNWLAQVGVLSGRPPEVHHVAREVLSHRQQWGNLRDYVIRPMEAFAAISSTAAGDAGARLESCADAGSAVGDYLGATVWAWAAAIAALEAGDADSAARVANRAVGPAATHELFTRPGLEVALGRVAMIRGEHAAAEGHAHTALGYQTERGMRLWLADTIELLGRAAIAAESCAEGCRLLAAGQAFRTSVDQLRLPSAEGEVEASLAIARAALGDEFDTVWDEGEALSIDDAIAYATRARGERKRPSFGWDSLSPTELKVVGLVAEGLSNPAIGERMFIAPGTVKTHLSHIFAKLGVTSRAELAAAASKRELDEAERAPRDRDRVTEKGMAAEVGQ